MTSLRNLFIITLTLFAGLSRCNQFAKIKCAEACQKFSCTCIDTSPIFLTKNSVIFKVRSMVFAKCMSLRIQSADNMQSINHDAEITKLLSDSNSVVNIDRSEEIDGYIFQFLDLCNFVSLESYLKLHPEIKDNYSETLSLILKLSNAIHAIHIKSIIHTDLSLTSIAIDEMKDIRLLNFHNAVNLAAANDAKGKADGSNPAIVENLEQALIQIGPKQDVFSLGVIFFMISQGRAPFPKTSIYNVLNQQHAQKYYFSKGTPLAIIRIIHSCLRYYENDRKTIKELTEMIVEALMIKGRPQVTDGHLYLSVMSEIPSDDEMIQGHSNLVDDFSEMIFIVMFVFFVIPISVCLITRHLKAIENEAQIQAEQNAALAEDITEPVVQYPLRNGPNVVVV